jgi:small subunit ribosomal protein S27Ae
MADKEKPKAAPKGAEKKVQKKYERYEVSGDTLKRKNKTCPKCGPGIFMANHKDRWGCGKCGYMEKKG